MTMAWARRIGTAFLSSAMACSTTVDVGQNPDVDGGDPSQICEPRVSNDCTCTNGAAGSKVCRTDGMAFGACVCMKADGGPGTDGGPDPDGGPKTPTVPADISSSPLSALEAETHVAVAPNGYVAAAWIGVEAGGSSTSGYRFSTNRGDSWLPVSKVDSPAGRVSSDPVLATDAQSNFYLVWIGFHVSTGTPTDMATYVSIAPHGTTSFGAPVQVSDPADPSTVSLDKPWITVTAAGTIIVTYAFFDPNGTATTIFAATSQNGTTWSRTPVVSGTGQRNLAMPCTAGGRVWVVHNDDVSGTLLHWSDDQGVTWPSANAAPLGTPSNATFDDPSCVAASASSVWVEYESSTSGATASSTIEVAHSTTGGTTFGASVNVQDTPLAYHAQLALEPSGALDLVYYGGASEMDASGSYRRARSTNGGTTWTAGTVIKKPLTFLTDRTTQKWIGDYVGVATSGTDLFTVFTDNTTPASHVWFVRTSL